MWDPIRPSKMELQARAECCYERKQLITDMIQLLFQITTRPQVHSHKNGDQKSSSQMVSSCLDKGRNSAIVVGSKILDAPAEAIPANVHSAQVTLQKPSHCAILRLTFLNTDAS